MKSFWLSFCLIMITVQVYAQCNLQLTIQQSNSAICSGNPITLTALATGGKNYSYSWNTGETTPNIIVNKAGTYAVTVGDAQSGCISITRQIVITSASRPEAPTVLGTTICSGQTTTLTATAPGGTYQWYTAPSGGTLLHTGDSFSPANPLRVTTTYYVETTVSGCTSNRSAATIYVTPGPNVWGTTVCYGNIATIGAWGADSYKWYDSPNGGIVIGTEQNYTTPQPVTTTTYYYVQAYVNGCLSERITVPVYVAPLPDAPTASSITICAGSNANLSATAPGGTYEWFDAPINGNRLIVSPDFTTPVLNATTKYYLQTTLNGCTSKRTLVTVTVNPTPAAPVANGITICAKQSTTLTASGSAGTYQWINAAGTVISNEESLVTPVLEVTTTYFVQTTVGGCTSGRTPVTVTVKPIPAMPSVSNIIACSGSAATISVLSPVGSHEWFEVPQGGNSISTDFHFTTSILTETKTYYVQTTVGGCTSPRSQVSVTVLPIVPAPAATGLSICSGNKATLSATNIIGKTEWYDAAVGGNLLIANAVYITPEIAATTTYYVQNVSGNCVSERVPVVVTVGIIQPPPTANDVSVCFGGNTVLTANGSGTMKWYSASAGGTLLHSGSTLELTNLKSNRTVYVQSTENNCASSRVAVNVNVIQAPEQDFYFPSGTYCPSGVNAIPVINNPLGGTFSAIPASGIVFRNTSTGEIDMLASTPGAYQIVFTNNSPCANVSHANINITTLPNATFFYDPEYCQNGQNPKATFPPSSSAGRFTSSPVGLVFIGDSLEIDLKKSLPNTYIITNTIDITCGGDSKTFTLKINPVPTVKAGPDQTVPFASTVSLAGTISSGTGTWTGGTGTFTNPSLPNANYIPVPGETHVVLKFTANTVGSCIPPSDEVNITFNPRPNPPLATTQTICKNSIAVLDATGEGSIQWFDAAVGGNLLGTDKIYSTLPLSVNKSYYVQQIVDGVPSFRREVLVTVSPDPAAPTVNNPPLCLGMPAELIATGPANSTFEWYTAATNGNLLGTTALLQTQALYANISFYVQLRTADGCLSKRIEVPVVVNPIPSVTSNSTGGICSGVAQSYTIVSDVNNSTFMWTRMQVPNISNPAIENRVSGVIDETLINTGTSALIVDYLITPMANGCPGTIFKYSVTVFPVPLVLSAAKDTICYGEALSYAVNYNLGGTYFYWSRDAVVGISNNAVSMQQSSTLRETLINTTIAPIEVKYNLYSSTANCAGPIFNYTVTVNPYLYITSIPSKPTCSEELTDYLITANVANATFVWSRPAVANISNAAVSGKTSDLIQESLINIGTTAINVPYTITPYINGCPGNVFTYTLVVQPKPFVLINSNSPVCISNTIKIITEPIPGAIYNWTGPNGFISHDPNPVRENAKLSDAGTYKLELIIDGCTSNILLVDIKVNALPKSNAGADAIICKNKSSIALAGKITGGTTTGVWTTNGTGSFSPLNNDLNAKYIFTEADKTAGSVILTLTSTSSDDCIADPSSLTVTFQPVPHVDAGKNLNVCIKDNTVPLKGHIGLASGGIWSTSGSGNFNPSNTIIDKEFAYIPSAADKANGSVKITLSSTGNGSCNVVQKDITITFTPPPTISAGEDKLAIRKTTFVLNPTTSDKNVRYRWTPNVNLSSDTVRNPTVTVDTEIDYTLTVIDSRGCDISDVMHIEVLEPLKMPNTFTPNGDGINDKWNINDLLNYPGASVSVFTRNGDKVYTSEGYNEAWDGSFNGSPLPFGTYYYIVKSKFENLTFSGYVAIIK